MSRIFSNPLTELAEFEELSRDLSRKKGPVHGQRLYGFAKGSPEGRS